MVTSGRRESFDPCDRTLAPPSTISTFSSPKMISELAGEGRRTQRAVNEPRATADASPAHRVESNVFDTSVYDNSVYDADASTIGLISSYARRWAAAGAR